MKKAISIVLVIFVLLTGCTDSSSNDVAVTYVESQGEILLYNTIEELTAAAPCIFEGTVVDISFWVQTYWIKNYGDSHTLWTIYEVEVAERYQGDVGTTEYVAMQFGLKDYKVNEQIQAQRDAGIEDATYLCVTKYSVLDIGANYLFLANDDFYEHYIAGINPIQFAVNNDPDLNFFAPYFSPEEIITYIQENPQ